MTIVVVICTRVTEKKRGFARSKVRGLSVPQKKPNRSRVRKQWSEKQEDCLLIVCGHAWRTKINSKDHLSGRVVHGVKPDNVAISVR